MDDLVRWLGEQLDIDTARAEAATWCEEAGVWQAEPSPFGARDKGQRWYVEDAMDDGVVSHVDPKASDDEGVARHIAEWDPSRVLREIEATRRLIRAHAKWCSGECEAKYPDGGFDAAHYWNIKLRAEVYDQRPGYQESWRP